MPRALLATCATACAGDPVAAPPVTTAAPTLAAPIELPIEVLPLDPDHFDPDLATGVFYAAERTVELAAAPVDGRLYVQGHRLDYRDGHMRPDTLDTDGDGDTSELLLVKEGKASVWFGDETRVADPACPWVDLVDGRAGLTVMTPEAYYGGIGGGFRTVRLTIALTELPCVTAGLNALRFRFNGTDGASSGYRIVDVDVLDAAGASIVPAGDFAVVDPATWTQPTDAYGVPADAVAGQALFEARNTLRNDPTAAPGTVIVAACADCHAWDGRDLAYYAYSNRSIIGRAVFHGLSELEGEQIASYIRSHPAGRLGRPWNPPYQPGVGTDTAGPGLWAAGAGLGAVLDHEMAEDGVMLEQVVPDLDADGVHETSEIVDAILGTGRPATTLNMREVPITLQFPDWASWLPEIHPLDLWGEGYWQGDWNGAGDFDTHVSYDDPAGSVGMAVATGYFDDDPSLDVAVAGHGSATVSVFLGVADGSLTRFTTQPAVAVGDYPKSIAVADFNGDGHDDLAVANYGSTWVSIRLGVGDGTFTAGVDVATPVPPRGVEAGDIDGDGHRDLVILGLTAVLFRAGNGDGTFTTPVPDQVAAVAPAQPVVADLDGDGDDDLAFAESTLDRVRVFRSNGAARTLTLAQTLTVGDYPYDLTVADLIADQRLDLAICNTADDTVTLAKGTANGFVVVPTTLATGDLPSRIVSADLDGDGDRDLAVINAGSDDDVGVFYRIPTGFAPMVTFDGGGDVTDLAVGNFDEASAADLVTANASGGDMSVLLARAHDPNQTYLDLRAWLASGYVLGELPTRLGDLEGAAQNFVGTGMYPIAPGLSDGWRGHRGLVLDHAVLRGYNHELVKRTVAQWVAVKTWELINEYSLEALGPSLFGVHGEALSWPTGKAQSVHPIAPHITSVTSNHFQTGPEYSTDELFDPTVTNDACAAYDAVADHPCNSQVHAKQAAIKGDYDSTVWYHLQLVLNAGARSLTHPLSASPVDMGYAYLHIDDVGRRTGTGVEAVAPYSGWEGLRQLATMIKFYQERNNGKGPVQNGWAMRDVSPRLLVSSFDGQAEGTELWRQLDAYEPGIRVAATNAFLQVWNDVVTGPAGTLAGFTPTTWPRCGDGAGLPLGMLVAADHGEDPQVVCEAPITGAVRETWANIDPADYTVTGTTLLSLVDPVLFPPADVEATEVEFDNGYHHHADHIYRAAYLLLRLGADEAEVCTLLNWAEAMWPGPGWTEEAHPSTGANHAKWQALRAMITGIACVLPP